MTLIKKQHKDEKNSAASEKKPAASKEAKENLDGKADKNKEANPEVKAEKAADGAKEAKKDSEKKPSEMDFLKLYLKQSMEELKKQKDENEAQKKRVDELDSQLRTCKDKYDALVKEYENYRRRTTEEKENLGSQAISKSVKALLPALDNLERAMPFADTNPESFKTGVEMTLRQLSDAFVSLGVEEIEAEKGGKFDPNFHDAVMHVDDDTLGESEITDVFQKGYKIGDKVIRHSVVKVAN